MPVTRFAAILLFAACTQTAVAADKRQHGSHEHGTAKLDVAIEQNALYIALDTPAANIIGFEHAPVTKEQKASLRNGITQLKQGGALFITPQAAGCRLADADVESPFTSPEQHAHSDEHGHEKSHAKHDHDKHKHEEHGHHDKHDHDKHERHGHEHAAQEVHADFRASWQFDCKNAGAIKQLNIRIFDKFPDMQRLQVQTITSERQGGTILTSSNPVLTF